MLRLLNVVAVAALIGSAVFAYSIKYETILYAEQILKTRHLIAAEQDGIERLRAEWAILTRPDRLAALSTPGAEPAAAVAGPDRRRVRPARPAAQGRFDRPQARVARPVRTDRDTGRQACVRQRRDAGLHEVASA